MRQETSPTPKRLQNSTGHISSSSNLAPVTASAQATGVWTVWKWICQETRILCDLPPFHARHTGIGQQLGTRCRSCKSEVGESNKSTIGHSFPHLTRRCKLLVDRCAPLAMSRGVGLCQCRKPIGQKLGAAARRCCTEACNAFPAALGTVWHRLHAAISFLTVAINR
ncbi:hypothetical protein Pelo_18814 [Pelomyxa schiedti]|nr:hypothetical protein Pelo_18814 [Pelomyxa schiedti]